MSRLLSVEGLSINYQTNAQVIHAVRNVSLNLDAGQVTVLLGESGSGKTALCRSLIGILPKNGYVAQGEVCYKGQPLDITSEKVMRTIRGNEIAMVFQDPMTALNPTLTIGRQIQEAVLLHQNISKREAKQKVFDLMIQVGLDKPEVRYHQYPHQFSGGMRQRCVIAMALACQPSILIADEPTTALDVTIQKQILDLLKRLQKEMEISVLLITHDLGVAAYMADALMVMYQGEIVEQGTPHEVFNAPKHHYTRMLMFYYDRVVD